MPAHDKIKRFEPSQLTAPPVDQLRDQINKTLVDGAHVRLKMVEQHLGAITLAAQQVIECLRRGGKVLFCGNGGSAADAQHLAAEFVCRFTRDRVSLPALALTTDTSALTAIGNDYGFEHIYSRQISSIGNPTDLLIAISTSGNSPNVLRGVETARQLGIYTIGLTGENGGALAAAVDLALKVPSSCTAHIQESHIAIGHALCGAVDLGLGVK